MLSAPLWASVARVAVVGGLMAAGAGGIYFVVTRTADGTPGQQAVAPTAGITATQTPSAVVPTTTAITSQGTGTPTTTPTPGLTDTGYKAPDGRPLYKECIQTNPPLPLPPMYPTPTGPIEYPPTPAVLNLGPTPAPAQLPPFDPMTLAPASTAGWVTYTSKCFGFSVSYPPDWVVSSPFTVGGYQQGEDAILESPDRRAKVEIHVIVSAADQLTIAASNGGRKDVYLRQKPTDTTWKGKRAVTEYAFVYGPDPPDNVIFGRMVSLGGSTYVDVSYRLWTPYDEAAARSAATVLESMQLP